MESLRALPERSARVEALVPTLLAAWRAGQRGVALSSAVRAELESDQPLQWPQELADEFVATLREFADTVPTLEEAIPIANDLVELGGEKVDPEAARQVILDVLVRLEGVAEKLLYRLFDVAFFAPDPSGESNRAQQLLQFFQRLEELFDRSLAIWLEHQATQRHS